MIPVQKIMWRVIALGRGNRRGGRGPGDRDRDVADDPPRGPTDESRSRNVRWRDAFIWAISVAVGAAVARVVAERGAATAWEAATGSPPPGLDT